VIDDQATMRLKFGDYVLDMRARQLERGGKPVPLEPKMYELLEVLITRRGSVVTNNELDEIIWPQVYVARTSLTRLVSELRALLGDTPRDPRIIRTVYKKGYSFCAEVTSGVSSAQASAVIELVWKKQTMPLMDGEHIAGRGADCSLVIDATTVSRRHARISTLTRLAAGNEVILGKELLRVRLRDPAALTVRVDADTDTPSKVRGP
jgi:DNA-binding winged helix-turn-helix (wHTH) protein